LLCRANCQIPADVNDIDFGVDKLRHKFRNQINARSIRPPIDRQVLALDKAELPEFIEHRDEVWRTSRANGHPTDAMGAPSLLRPRRERPRYGGSTDKCDEFPSPHGFAHAKDYIGCENNITFLD
jgi:hypothetical protein